jgi:hypothetical protein
MQTFTLVIICCITLAEFLVQLLNLPEILRFLPEALSAVVILYVLVAGTRDRFRLVAPKYWIVFGALALVLICGIINGEPGAGPVISASRFYLRAVPLFFLAAVLPLSEIQLRRQLRWLLAIALIQAPVAVYQRWVVQAAGRFSGDDVKGTLLDSGILTIYLICGIAVLTGLLMRGRIRGRWYALLFILLIIPTTINETKVTVFYLPMAILIALIVGAAPGKRLRYVSAGLLGLIVTGALFVPVYNLTQANNPYKNEKDITTLFTNEKLMGRYLSSDVSGVGTKKDVRRVDAIVVPLQFLAKDPVRLAFGLGTGAVSPSNLGRSFQGDYHLLFKKFLIISFAYFLLEFGIFGVMLILVLFWMVFADTLAVARNDKDSLFGALAVGWAAVVAIFAIDIVYTNFHEFASVTYLYWYFSGLICARCMAIAYEKRSRSNQATALASARRLGHANLKEIGPA